MKYILCLLVALASFSASPSRALSPEVQADLLLLQAIEAIDAEDYRAAMAHFEKLAALDVPKPDAFLFHYGKTALKAGKYETAHKMLEGYINTAGSSGEFYQSALKNYIEAEKHLNAANARAAALKAEAQNNLPICKNLQEEPLIYHRGTPKGRGAELLVQQINACRAALRGFPNDANLMVILSKALLQTANSSDWEAGSDLIEQAANLGHSDAQASLSYMYRSGHRRPKKPKTALEWAENSAAQNDAAGLAALADHYWHGIAVTKDTNKAVDLSRRAAASGQTFLQVRAAIYLFKSGDLEEAARWIGEARTNVKAPAEDFNVSSWTFNFIENGGSFSFPGAADAAVYYLKNREHNEYFKGKLENPAIAVAVQRDLAETGHYRGAIDGSFGSGSLAALHAYCGC